MTACRICGGDTVPPTPGHPEEEDHYCESCGTTTAAGRYTVSNPDGCWTEFDSAGRPVAAAVSPDHVPGCGVAGA